MRNKGAMPIPHLVALIIGLIVIGVIAYMFVTKTGIFAGFTSEAECSAFLRKYCLDWSLRGWAERGEGEGFGSAHPECKGVFEKISGGISLNYFDTTDEIAMRVCKEKFGIS